MDHLFFICLMLKLQKVDINCVEDYMEFLLECMTNRTSSRIYSIDIFAHMHYVSCMAKMSYHYL